MPLLIGKDSANNKLREIELDASGQLKVANVSVTSNALPTGAATESTLSTLDLKVTACNTGAVVVSSSALPSGAASESSLSSLDGKVTACNTGAVVVSSSALPSGAATEVSAGSCASSLATLAATVSSGVVQVSSSGGGSLSFTSSTVMNAVSVSAGATVVSSSFDMSNVSSPRIAIFGRVGSGGGSADIDIQLSSDNSNFYNLANEFITLDLATGDFGASIESGARYVRISVTNNGGSSESVTALISGR